MSLCIFRSLLSRSPMIASPLSSRPPLSSSCFYSLLSLFSSQRKTSIPDQSVADFLVDRHNFSEEAASKVSSAVTRLKNPEISTSILSYLKECGLSHAHIERLVQRVPRILFSNLETTVKPKIRYLQELVDTSADIVDIISVDPYFFKRSLDKRLGPSLIALVSVMGSKAGVVSLLKHAAGWLLAADLEKTLVVNVQFLKSCGMNREQIMAFIHRCPRLVVLKPECFVNLVRRTDEMGVDKKSASLLPAMRVLVSGKRWETKTRLLQDLGFSREDMLFTFRRVPQVFLSSDEKIMAISQFLVKERFDISFLRKYPEIFLCSLEKRLKPRHMVLKRLENKAEVLTHSRWAYLFKMSHVKFCKKYLTPHENKLEEPFNADDVLS